MEVAFQGWVTRRFLPAVALLVGFSVTGCGGQTDGRVPLSGQVFFGGQPLDRGSIEFHPRDASGTLTGAMVTNGEFAIPAAQGAKPGVYEVRVFAAGAGVEVDGDEPPGPESQAQVAAERIPARFNVKSELEVEVGSNGNKDLRFDLQES